MKKTITTLFIACAALALLLFLGSSAKGAALPKAKMIYTQSHLLGKEAEELNKVQLHFIKRNWAIQRSECSKAKTVYYLIAK